MKREEKIKLAIEKGITCNPETGEVFGAKGGLLISINKSGYKVIKIRGDFGGEYIIRQHQFIWYWVNKEVVDVIDHINGIKTDNRISNLRSVTCQQNMFNTKCKGCHFYKRVNKWMSYITVDYKKIHLGYFNTEEEAKQAYSEAKQKYHQI